MKVSTICPCCSRPLLHHLDHHREYWFCRHCWQEMPDLSANLEKKQQSSTRIMNLSANFSTFTETVLVS